MNLRNTFSEVWTQELGPGGQVVQKHFYLYACGHCSNQVAMRHDRERPRNLCLGCNRWICEQSEICNARCTPLYAMAEDRFERVGEWGELVPAIMSGARTMKEAAERGLLKG